MTKNNRLEEGTNTSYWSAFGWMDIYFFGAMALYTLACLINIAFKFTAAENIQFAWLAVLLPPVIYRMYRDRRGRKTSAGE